MTTANRVRPRRQEHGTVLAGVKATPSGWAYGQP